MAETRARMRGRILQLSPNDHPPFADICGVYARAAESLGCHVETVYLGPAFAEPQPRATYLDLPDLSRVPDAAQALRSSVESTPGAVVLGLCHRYRAYRVLLESAVPVGRFVAIAHEYGFFRRWQRRLRRRLRSRHVLFAGVSPAVQADLARSVPGALCLANGIELDVLEQTLEPRDSARAALGVVPDAFAVGVIGRLIPWKQPELAVEALRLLLDRVPHAELVLIGDGEQRAGLEAAAVGLPVVFAGQVTRARRYLRALDALLVVSSPREAFGMAALEAMAAGVPVVAGPAPGPRSVLGDAALYYDAADPMDVAGALARLHQELGSPALEARVQEGVARARRQYSVAAVAARLDDLFFQAPQ